MVICVVMARILEDMQLAMAAPGIWTLPKSAATSWVAVVVE